MDIKTKHIENLTLPQEFIINARDNLSANANGKWLFGQGYFSGNSIFESEVEFDDLILKTKINAEVQMHEEDKTNTISVIISNCIFNVNLFNEDGQIDLSEKFKHNIFNQLKEVEGEITI